MRERRRDHAQALAFQAQAERRLGSGRGPPESSEEREAGGALDAIRSRRNANHYRIASTRLGVLPKFSGVVVRAARERVGES